MSNNYRMSPAREETTRRIYSIRAIRPPGDEDAINLHNRIPSASFCHAQRRFQPAYSALRIWTAISDRFPQPERSESAAQSLWNPQHYGNHSTNKR